MTATAILDLGRSGLGLARPRSRATGARRLPAVAAALLLLAGHAASADELSGVVTAVVPSKRTIVVHERTIVVPEDLDMGRIEPGGDYAVVYGREGDSDVLRAITDNRTGARQERGAR